MKFQLAVIAIAMIASITAGAQAPSAAAILEGARMAASLNKLDEGLSGNLKKDGKAIPVTLFLRGKDIQFQYAEVKDVWQIYHLRLNDNSFDLFEIIKGKTVGFPGAKLIKPIAGTDVTYEDLALRFFYWPNPKLEAEENINGEACYKLRLDKPKNTEGRYAAVFVWVHKKFGAFMRIQGYDKTGGLAKEFQVQEVMPVTDKIWTLKKMQIATHDPTTGRRLSITNLVFDTPRKTKPAGLR
jgi:hypothetical protein